MTSSSSSSDLFIQKDAVPNQIMVPISIKVLESSGVMLPFKTRKEGISVNAKATNDINFSIFFTISKLKE
ncbi:hypothetical protein SAMN04489723_108168 [Algoriphagus aquimarinus]|uniref:Uncharacterized protein n=1 Tax=Algoriphagus aquimarinus TaxID=237018 RepID=A0A1I1ANI6_9BACT|nr:hypothetical protein SAMN04489723_108168 [Algoriphagus aquimarinus]